MKFDKALKTTCKARPLCWCGHGLVIRDTSCGLASFFYWTCPKKHWWSFSEHRVLAIGTSIPPELYELYGSRKNSA